MRQKGSLWFKRKASHGVNEGHAIKISAKFSASLILSGKEKRSHSTGLH
jgi:hypothetical protein